MKKIIFGLGTGRCGTMSLSNLLNFQENANFTHELESSNIPWNPEEAKFNSVLGKIQNRHQEFVGDVGLYYLPYCNQILKIKNSKIVILKRDRESVINSFMKKTRWMNHWCNHDGRDWRLSPWDKCFPKFKTRSKRDAVGKYYDLYYEMCSEIPKERSFWMTTEELNQEEKSLEMLRFCGFENPKFTLMHKNRGAK